MTMSTYKSLGGPPSGLIVTNEADIAERLDAIAFPGLTANFDAAKSAALAITLLDWRVFGRAYAAEMAATARRSRRRWPNAALPVFGAARLPRSVTGARGPALRRRPGGGEAAARANPRLRHRPAGRRSRGRHERACASAHPRLVRWGMGPEHMPELAALILRGLVGNEDEARRGGGRHRL